VSWTICSTPLWDLTRLLELSKLTSWRYGDNSSADFALNRDVLGSCVALLSGVLGVWLANFVR
jgi:hypothetical protein